MAGAESTAHVPEADHSGAAGVTRFSDEHRWEEILEFWFAGNVNENYRTKWFPTSGSKDAPQVEIDRIITTRFGDTLRCAESGQLDHWVEACPRSATALVVALDQFSRHIYRHEPTRDKVKACDARALTAARAVLAKGWETDLPLPFHVFLLMPLRHTPTVPGLREVMQRVDERSAREGDCASLLEKFRKTTLRNLQDLEGKQWVEGQDIMEFAGFELEDEGALRREVLYKTFVAFLEARPPQQAMLVSLSGGVDSMVACFILAKLAPLYGRFGVVAAHIDYGNRPESSREAAFVERWCRGLGVRCFVRRIDEVKRGATDREEYERESRNIRYNLYKEVMAETGARGVVVGHHRGDVQENIIANMFRGKSLLGINGMGATSTVNGVEVWRPMLPHDKDVVFAFSHKYGVPYFKDTTPTWSTRGKLRTQLMPLLADMFGDGYLRCLSGLGQDADELSDLLNGALLRPFWAQVQMTHVVSIVEAAAYIHQPIFFWKEALRHVVHSMGTGMFRDKPLHEFLQRMRSTAAGTPGPCGFGDGWITLKKGTKTMIDGSRLLIFTEEFFPRQPYVQAGTPIELGREYTFGPWTVLATVDAAASPGARSAEGPGEEGSQEPAPVPGGSAEGPGEDTRNPNSSNAHGQEPAPVPGGSGQEAGDAGSGRGGPAGGGGAGGEAGAEPRQDPAERRVFLADVLTGAFEYWLATFEGEALHVAPEVKLRPLRGLDRAVRTAIPLVNRAAEGVANKNKPKTSEAGAGVRVRVRFRFQQTSRTLADLVATAGSDWQPAV